MHLYGSTTSPFVRHCRIALLQANANFDFHIVDYQTSATQSPVQKIPYLKTDTGLLTDSSSILMFIRQQQRLPFPHSLQDFELYTLINTVADAAINLFLLEKDGITRSQAPYLQRQFNRIMTGLEALNQQVSPNLVMTQDGQLRCACIVDWILFRQRVDMKDYARLLELVEHANEDQHFKDTAPQ